MLEQLIGPQSGNPYDTRQRSSLARALFQMGSGNQRPRHWAEGMGDMAAMLAGAYIDNKDREEAKALSKEATAGLERAMGGGLTSALGTEASPSSMASPSGVAAISPDKETFISDIMPHAMRVAQETGLDPRLVIAQAGLESGWGKSAPGNNYFGIKSHGTPGGQTLATTEVVNGKNVPTNDSFRQYGGMGESAMGYADFLKTNPRYKPMLSAQGLDAQVEALGQSGYATDPNYGSKVGSIARSIQLPGGGAEKPVQVASANPEFAPQQSPPPPQASADPFANPRVRQLFQAISNPYLPPAAREAGKIRLQAEITRMQRDPADALLKREQLIAAQRANENAPLDIDLKRLQVDEARKKASAVEMDRVQGGDGTFYERPKGTDQPFRLVEGIRPKIEEEAEAREKTARGLGLKPEDPAFKSYVLTGRMPREDQAPLSATDKKAILEADEMVVANEGAIKALRDAKDLSSGAYDSFLAAQRSWLTSNFGNDAGQKTQELKNVIESNALGQLKAIFGAAPTEGERKVLLEIQGSVNMPARVREAIWDRAMQAAEKHLEFNRQRATELRGGTFYKSKPADGVSAPSGQGNRAAPDPLGIR